MRPATGAREESERDGVARASETSAENWAEALELAESPDALERPSTAFDAACWTEANAAAVAWTGFGAAADLEAWTATTALTATDGAIPGETGCALGTTEGADKDGDNDNDGNVFGIVPKTGIPGSEGLELAPAALTAEGAAAEGTETDIDRIWARAGVAPSVMDSKRAIVCRMSLMASL
ncbi:MAG: hypothetical protein HYV14_10595 [Elusimicrobia bacterium]|nr:hypothetical protein [Elusimicrobiota bacterium]